jgi:amino acid transporter
MQYSRLPAAMADDGLLPRFFGRRHPRTGAPTVALVSCGAAWMLCLGLSFTKLVILDVLLTGLSLMLEFAALVALRIREPELRRPYRIPGGLPAAIGIGLLPAALLVLTSMRNASETFGPLTGRELNIVLVFAGAPAYWLCLRPMTGLELGVLLVLAGAPVYWLCRWTLGRKWSVTSSRR